MLYSGKLSKIDEQVPSLKNFTSGVSSTDTARLASDLVPAPPPMVFAPLTLSCISALSSLGVFDSC